MFTGLIASTGTILNLEERPGTRRIMVGAPGIALRTGDSVAVSGVCLTALDIETQAGATRFYADLAAETVTRTSLGRLRPGSVVNLELPTPAGNPLGGHIVQGHVDGVGRLLRLERVDPAAEAERADWWLSVAVPENVSRCMVEKGSVAIEGISLTIARWTPGTAQGDVVHAAIIPHTYAHTNLHTLAAGAPVNIEADAWMKLLEQRRSEARETVTVESLIANGY